MLDTSIMTLAEQLMAICQKLPSPEYSEVEWLETIDDTFISILIGDSLHIQHAPIHFPLLSPGQ